MKRETRMQFSTKKQLLEWEHYNWLEFCKKPSLCSSHSCSKLFKLRKSKAALIINSVERIQHNNSFKIKFELFVMYKKKANICICAMGI